VGKDPALPYGAINALTKAGYSPLHLAVISRGQQAVLWLLASGASTDQKNQEHKTAADLASESGDLPLVNLISTFRATASGRALSPDT
jgi:ankyrin repeat protein